MKIASLTGLLFLFIISGHCIRADNKSSASISTTNDTVPPVKPGPVQLDTALYNRQLLALVHNQPSDKWPVKTAYPPAGAILPFKRVVAYYGNFYSAGMGILGQLPADTMLAHLQEEVKKWDAADTLMPALPALHYIAVTAQGSKGKDGKYRLRMPFEQIDKVIALAKKIDAIVFLDVQVGHSLLQQEIPLLEKYLQMPGVHLGIDPEYSMKGGQVPGSVIGTFDAADINYASEYLSNLVTQYNLPPKILIVHRFTQGMVTNYKKIITRPEVQLVMSMDGFGFPAKKINSYKTTILNQPVEFTGFKLFYKQDTPKLMEPAEVLKLYPKPVYIQYQ
jgi:hypothetical protein